MTTAHNLPFEACPWKPPTLLISYMMGLKYTESDIVAFRVGTCEGIYQTTNEAFQIIAVKNSNPGNGHFEDVLQWFEASCRRDKKALMFMEILNEDFGDHLEMKRGFKRQGAHMIKKF